MCPRNQNDIENADEQLIIICSSNTTPATPGSAREYACTLTASSVFVPHPPTRNNDWQATETRNRFPRTDGEAGNTVFQGTNTSGPNNGRTGQRELYGRAGQTQLKRRDTKVGRPSIAGQQEAKESAGKAGQGCEIQGPTEEGGSTQEGDQTGRRRGGPKKGIQRRGATALTDPRLRLWLSILPYREHAVLPNVAPPPCTGEYASVRVVTPISARMDWDTDMQKKGTYRWWERGA